MRRRRLGNPIAFGVLVLAVVAAPFVFSNYRTYQLAFVGSTSSRSSASTSSPASPGRSRSATARSWGSARIRRRSSSSTTASVTSGRSRSPASSPEWSGSRSASRRRGSPARTSRSQRSPSRSRSSGSSSGTRTSRRPERQESPAAPRRARLAHEPLDLVLRRLLGGGARDVPARLLHRARPFRPCAAQRARQRDRSDRERHLDRGREDGCIRHLRVLLRRRRLAVRNRQSRTSTRTRSRSTSRSCCSSGSCSAAPARCTECCSARCSCSSSASPGARRC